MDTSLFAKIQRHAFFRHVSSFIELQGIIKGCRHIDMALSGGADSAALTAVLTVFCQNRDIELRAHHIRHGLRDNDADDERIALDIAHSLGIECIQTHLHLGPQNANIEEIARKARYSALFSALQSPSVQHPAALALAHHGDENVETAIWRLGRGCGLEGLCMSPVRIQEGIRLIRPLLVVSKSQIYGFLSECGIPWIEDPSNASDLCRRNRIRHGILPEIVKESTSPDALYRSLINIRHDADAMTALAAAFAQKMQISPGLFYCTQNTWQTIESGAQAQILRHIMRIISPGCCPQQTWIQNAVHMLAVRSQTHRTIENGKIKIQWTRCGVEICDKNPAFDSYEIHLPVPVFNADLRNFGQVTIFCAVPETVPPNTPSMLVIDDKYISQKLTVVNAGRFSALPASDGHTAELREAFRAQGIPDHIRNEWPVLCLNTQPLWIFGGMRTIHALPAQPCHPALFILWKDHSHYL